MHSRVSTYCVMNSQSPDSECPNCPVLCCIHGKTVAQSNVLDIWSVWVEHQGKALSTISGRYSSRVGTRRFLASQEERIVDDESSPK